jgi:hypothetical protein
MREQNGTSRWRRVLVAALSLPVRLLGLLILVAFVPGLLRMIDLASLSGREEIDATLLAVRTLNQEKAFRPLLYLGYRASVQENLIRVSPENTVMGEFLNLVTLNATRAHTTNIDSRQLADGTFQHTITFSDGTSGIDTSTTPHLKVPMKEQSAAANQLQQLLPQEFDELLEWGESLFVSEWLLHHPLSSVPAGVVPEPKTGTADERAWLAWTALCGSNREAPAELFRLRELFEASFPNEKDRTEALNWANTFYERLRADFTSYQNCIRREEQLDADRGTKRTVAEQSRSRVTKKSFGIGRQRVDPGLWRGPGRGKACRRRTAAAGQRDRTALVHHRAVNMDRLPWSEVSRGDCPVNCRRPQSTEFSTV